MHLQTFMDAVKEQLKAKLTFVPLWAENHWSLMTVKVSAAKQEVEWRDSLTAEAAPNRVKGERFLQLFLPDAGPLEPRRNASLQVVASATCGAFVLWWIEQALRSHCRREAPCSMGWPCSSRWAEKLQIWCTMLQKMQAKAKADSVKAEAKSKAPEASKPEATSAAEIAAAAGVLAEKAATASEVVKPTAVCYENLTLQQKERLKFMFCRGDLVGGCPKCKFLERPKTGCYDCRLEKRVRADLKTMEGGWKLTQKDLQPFVERCMATLKTLMEIPPPLPPPAVPPPPLEAPEGPPPLEGEAGDAAQQ